MPEEAGTWLYFEYAVLTLQVAQSERANVPRKRKMLRLVILWLKYSSLLQHQRDPALRFFLFDPKTDD
jgi:hypothetical protein